MKLKNYIIIWIVLTIALATMSYIAGKDGGSSTNPIYLSHAQQENPSLLFWDNLPFAAIISGVIVTVIGILRWLYLKYETKSK